MSSAPKPNNHKMEGTEPMYQDIASEIKNIVEKWTENNIPRICEDAEIQNGMELYRLELKVISLLATLGTMIIGHILKSVIQDRKFQKECNKLAKQHLGEAFKNEKPNQRVTIRLLTGGEVKVKTTYCRRIMERDTRGRKRTKRGKEGNGLYPALSRLGIHHRATPALISEICQEVAEGPSLELAQQRLKRHNIDFNVKSIRTLTNHFGYHGLEWRTVWQQLAWVTKAPKDKSFEDKVVVVGVDGGRLRERHDLKGRLRKGKNHHRFKGEWKEPKQLVIAVLDEKGRKSRKERPIYNGTLENGDALFEFLGAYLHYYSIEKAEKIVFVGDGAPWIWSRVEELVSQLGLDPSRVHRALDYYHAVQHLHDVAALVSYWSDRQRKVWLTKMKRALREGDVEVVFEGIKALCVGRNAKAIRKELTYFEERRHLMMYKRLRAENLPIGSGIIESTIRRVINLRLKGNGIFWRCENAEGMIQMRSYYLAGRWEELLENVLDWLSIDGRMNWLRWVC